MHQDQGYSFSFRQYCQSTGFEKDTSPSPCQHPGPDSTCPLAQGMWHSLQLIFLQQYNWPVCSSNNALNLDIVLALLLWARWPGYSSGQWSYVKSVLNFSRRLNRMNSYLTCFSFPNHKISLGCVKLYYLELKPLPTVGGFLDWRQWSRRRKVRPLPGHCWTTASFALTWFF